MRKNIIVSILLLSVIDISAQKLEGSWQRTTDIIGSGNGEIYRFYEGNQFEFFISQYSYLSTIISFKGIYNLKNDVISFNIISRKEIIGAHIEQGSLGFQDNWIIEGGEIQEIKQDSVTYSFDFSYKRNINQESITIGNGMYFKVKEDN